MQVFFYQMGKLDSITLAWVQTDTEKYKQDLSLPTSPAARMKVRSGAVPKQERESTAKAKAKEKKKKRIE